LIQYKNTHPSQLIHNILFGKLYTWPQPIHWSYPTLTLFPFPIFHINKSPIIRKAKTITFHIMGTLLTFFTCLLKKSSIESSMVYIYTIVLHQIPLPRISLKTPLVSSALEKRNRFFNPHPRKLFGSDSIYHITQGIIITHKPNKLWISIF